MITSGIMEMVETLGVMTMKMTENNIAVSNADVHVVKA